MQSEVTINQLNFITMKKITLLFMMLLATSIITNAQITVDNSPGVTANPPFLYTDLTSAISAASNDAVIYVQPSEISYGIITVGKPLTLIGFGHSDPDKKTLLEDLILTTGASNTTVSGFHIDDDFYLTNPLGTPLSNLVIENNLIDSVLEFDDGGVDNVIIRGNIINIIGNISGNSSSNNYTNALITNNIVLSYIGLKNHQSITIKNNIFLSPNVSYAINNAGNSTGSITVQNNIVFYNSGSMNDPNSTGVIYENCLSYNVGAGSVVPLIGSTNLDNQDPLFVEDNDNAVFDGATNDFNLQAGSPAIGMGAGGVDMGLFDGSAFIFNNYGYTNGIPTVKITDITDRIAPTETLNVTISTNSN